VTYLSADFWGVQFLSADIGGKLRCDWLTAAIDVNKMANVEWTDDVVFKLIELYEHYQVCTIFLQQTIIIS